MRHPRRQRRKKFTRRLVVRTDATPHRYEFPDDKTITAYIDPRHFAVWTPARGRSKHWLNTTRVRQS